MTQIGSGDEALKKDEAMDSAKWTRIIPIEQDPPQADWLMRSGFARLSV
ncbi:MAG: hypothetical protein GX811_04285 [Lentisphaerae bacterium]|nr:hypothetical protein [Lentisphaerota bacterium]